MSKCKVHNEYLTVCDCKQPDKGLKNGSCNRQACQEPGATYYNRVTEAWYCPSCANKINNSPFRVKEDAPLCSYMGEQA